MKTRQSEDRGLRRGLKRLILPSGRSARVIRGGILSGIVMELDFDHDTQRWLGLQEKELHHWLQRLTPGIRTALDVGASDGMYTLYFLAKTSAQKVYAFEPEAVGLAQMNRNLSLNGFCESTRVELITQCAGPANKDGSVSLDSYLSEIQFPCLVKVDIDGGEASLLEGAPNLLASRDAFWIIEVHSRNLQEHCLEVLRKNKYETFVVPNAWWRSILPELRPGELNQWIIGIPRAISSSAL